MTDTIARLVSAARPTDTDIDAEFAPATQARILDAILTSATTVPFAARHSRRWVGLVAAGVVVAVGGVTVQALLPSRTTTVVTQDPSGDVATTTVTRPPVGLPAAAALEPIAQLAAARPVVERTQYLHVVSIWRGDGGEVATSDGYTASDGWTWRKDASPRQTVWFLNEPSSLFRDLPTEPAALDARLRATGGTNSADERVFAALSQILRSAQASPAVQAAAIRVLDAISKHPQSPVTTKDNGPIATPVVTLELANVDGKAGVRATFSDATSRPDEYEWLVLDSATGALIESGTRSPKATGTSTMTSEIVTTLPAAFVTVLGTERVSKAVDG